MPKSKFSAAIRAVWARRCLLAMCRPFARYLSLSFVCSFCWGGGSQVSGSSPHAAAPRSPGAGLALAAWRWGGPHSPHRAQSKALKGSQNGHIPPRGPGLGLGSQ